MSKRKSPPDVRQLTARLAASNAKALRSLDQLTAQVDGVVAAIETHDWTKLRRHSAAIRRTAEEQGDVAVVAAADQLQQESRSHRSEFSIKRAAIRLLGAYGRMRGSRK